jgi:hypothetical protein
MLHKLCNLKLDPPLLLGKTYLMKYLLRALKNLIEKLSLSSITTKHIIVCKSYINF